MEKSFLPPPLKVIQLPLLLFPAQNPISWGDIATLRHGQLLIADRLLSILPTRPLGLLPHLLLPNKPLVFQFLCNTRRHRLLGPLDNSLPLGITGPQPSCIDADSDIPPYLQLQIAVPVCSGLLLIISCSRFIIGNDIEGRLPGSVVPDFLLRALAANILLIQEPFRLGIFQGPISGCAHALVRLAVAVGAGCSFPCALAPVHSSTFRCNDHWG